MDPWRPVQRSFYNHWEGGQGHVDIFVQSMATATEPRIIDRAWVTFYLRNRAILVGAPPDVPNEELLSPPVHESWLEDLQAFGSFERTEAAQAMAAHIRFVSGVPHSVPDYFIDVITGQARDTAVTAAALHHRAVRMVIDLNISVNWTYDDDYEDGVDSGDGGSYANDMEEVAAEEEAEAEADPTVEGTQVDPAAADEEMGDAEVHPAAPIEVVGGAEVDPPAPEAVQGEAEVIAGIGDIVLAEDPPDDPEDYAPLAALLAELIDEPLAPFPDAAGLPRGLAPAAIAYHVTVDTFGAGSPQDCPICLKGMGTGTPVGWLPCRHVFHPACITIWLARNASCPICRLQLPNNIDD